MAEPIISTLGIVGIKNCGAYDNSTNYEKLNVVTYQGSSYCAKGNTVGNLPTNTDYWDLLAQKGDVGPQGPQGPQGPKPVKGTDYYTAEDIAELESTLASDVTDEVTEQLGDLTSATPLVAETAADRVDTTKIYVLVTDGHWYWYDGSDWQDGGVYQATAISNNSIEPTMLKNIECYNLYDVSSIELQKYGGNYQRLIIPAKAGEKYGVFLQTDNGFRRVGGDGTPTALLYFFNNTMTDPDTSGGRIAINTNPTDDVTAPANTAWLVLYLSNSSTDPYQPTKCMLCEMTDKTISTLKYVPYGFYFKKPYIVEYSDGLYEELSTLKELTSEIPNVKPHKNKKILGLGDSYTFLDYYGPYLEAETGVTFTPRGSNGASIRYIVSDNYTPTGGGGSTESLPITAELLSQYDAVTCMAGTNNYGQSINPLGTINDEIGAYTVHGDIKLVIDKILSAKPDMPIIWCTEPFRLQYGTHPAPGGYAPNSQGYTMQDVANAIIEECKHYGIPCYDFYSNSGWNSYSVKKVNGSLVTNKFTYDGLHPKDGDGNGADLLGRSFGAFINNLRF